MLAILLLAGIVASPSQAPEPPIVEPAANEWLDWGEPAFDRARGEARPVLLVLGRTGRVRALEERAFSDPGTAEELHGYVGVHVDADERPDLAAIYASATVLLSEAAGAPRLPFAVVLTSEARPVAGTDLAPDGAADPARVRAWLAATGVAYRERRAEMEARAGVVTAALRDAQVPATPRGPLGADVVARALHGLAEAFDARRGRFGADPAALPHAALRLLLDETVRGRDPRALRMAVAALDALAGEPLAAREGRLADEALLLKAFCRGYEATGSGRHREAAEAIAAWAREAVDPAGGFVAAVDPGSGARDARVFAGASGLMTGALAVSGSVLARPGDLDAARTAAAGVLARLGPAGSLRHWAGAPDAGGPALLEDYAYLAEGFLDLHDATGEARWREAAASLAEAAVGRYHDATGWGFFDTDASRNALLVRTKNGYDTGLPCPNGVMASLLLRLARATGERRYAELARHTVEVFLGDLQRAPRGMESLAAAASALLGPPASAPGDSAVLPAEVVRGPVSVRVAVVGDGGSGRAAQAVLSVASGWHVVAPGARGPELLPVSLSVLEGAVAKGPPRYPPAAPVRRRFGQPVPGYTGEVTLIVSLRLGAGTPSAPRPVRLRIGFQACDEAACRPPESVLLEALPPALHP